MRQLEPAAEYLTAVVVLSILMINSFTGTHNISVWNSVELSLVIVIVEGSLGFPGGSVLKESVSNAGDTGYAGSIPRSGRSSGGGLGNPLQ